MNNHRNQPEPPGYVLSKCFSKARHRDIFLIPAPGRQRQVDLRAEASQVYITSFQGRQYQERRVGVSSSWAHTVAVSRVPFTAPSLEMAQHRKTTPVPERPFPQ